MWAAGGFESNQLDPALFAAFGLPALLTITGLAAHCDGGRRGATPGKRLLKLRVVDVLNGEPIGFRRGLIRRVVFWLGVYPGALGWLWCIWDRRHQAWHDKPAGTAVVDGRQ